MTPAEGRSPRRTALAHRRTRSRTVTAGNTRVQAVHGRLNVPTVHASVHRRAHMSRALRRREPGFADSETEP